MIATNNTTKLVSDVRAKHGTFHVLSADNTIGRSMQIYGEWAEPEVHLFEQLVTEGQHILEVGANIGTHTVPLSRMAGATGSVIAVEPLSINLKLLASNLLINECHNTTMLNAALSQRTGVINFASIPIEGPNNFGGLGVYHDAPIKTPVPSVRIDDLALKKLDFLKVDVEGAEREVILGGMDTIKRERPILFVESLNHHAATLGPRGHVDWLIENLKSLSYTFWHYITPLYNPDNFFGEPIDEFPGLWSFDVLCIPHDRGRVYGLSDAEHLSFGTRSESQWRSVRYETA